MRKKPTEAEEKLWKNLRFDTLGVRFRRQYVLEGAIFDFYCPELKLAIEVDGEIHDAQRQLQSDESRDERFVEQHHIETLRFSNNEVLHDNKNVLNNIKQYIQKHPPSLVERGRGGEVKKILDLGTGGGFPLLPLAICLPECSFVGVDSVQKKITAVQHIIDTLKIPNVRLICGRSEELGRDSAHREQYDIVLCRALAELNVLLEFAAPFAKAGLPADLSGEARRTQSKAPAGAKAGGIILCWKSLKIEQELKDSLLARSELSCQMENPYAYDLGGTWGRRQILVFRKRAKTNATYPRAVGEPKKKPLL